MRREILAKDIMTTDVVTLRADMGIAAAAELLVEKRVSSAPVIEVDFLRQILIGFVSEKDLMQCYATGAFHLEPTMTVREVMRPNPVCVRPSADLFTCAALFMQHGYRHLPVVSAQLLQGIVSRRDVLAALLVDYREWSKQDPKTRQAPDLGGIFTPRALYG
jgi:CBS domain-containing protein